MVGLGPGNPDQLTPEASTALREAQAVFGYGPYLDRVPVREHQSRYPSDNKQEIQRANEALTCATNGSNVVVVSGGDPGIFAMAAAVCEAVEYGPEAWKKLELRVLPGVSAMLAVAARVGAPLGHDFCVLSLSDNLKPWEAVEKRIEAAASSGFVIAFYNPVSRARPWQLERAFATLRANLPRGTPVIFGRAIGRPNESVVIATLDSTASCSADMSTCIIIGTAETRVIERPNREALVYTPRTMPRVII